MAAPFEVEFITPQRVLYTGLSERLSLPGVTGSLGILANHAPLLTELRIGEATVVEPGGGERRFYVGGGFLEVNDNRVTILAEDALGEDDMDPSEAERLHRIARENLEAAADAPVAAAAQIQFARAEARLQVVQRRRTGR